MTEKVYSKGKYIGEVFSPANGSAWRATSVDGKTMEFVNSSLARSWLVTLSERKKEKEENNE